MLASLVHSIPQLPEIRSSSAVAVPSEPESTLGSGFGSGARSGGYRDEPGSSQPAPTTDNSYAAPFRITGDERVGVYVSLSSLLGKARRIKEANKVINWSLISSVLQYR